MDEGPDRFSEIMQAIHDEEHPMRIKRAPLNASIIEELDRLRQLSPEEAVLAAMAKEEPIMDKQHLQDLISQRELDKEVKLKLQEYIARGAIDDWHCLRKRPPPWEYLGETTEEVKRDPVVDDEDILKNPGALYLEAFSKGADLMRNRAILTQEQQQVLDHFEEMKEPITREEAEKFMLLLKDELSTLSEEATIDACGAYRRGAKELKELDFLITTSDKAPGIQLLLSLLHRLEEKGIIVQQLKNLRSDSGGPAGFQGVARLPGGKCRRLDFHVYP